MSVLKQRRLLTSYEFQIQEDSVRVTERDLTSSRTYKVPFENIAAEAAEVALRSRGWFWAAIVLGVLSIITGVLNLAGEDVESGAWIFWGGFAVLAAVSFIASRREFLVFRAGDPALVLLKGRPTQGALDLFLSELQNRKRSYLAQRYLMHTPEGAAADAVHKLAWLRSEGVISDSEFEILKSDIMSRARSSTRSSWSSN